MKKGFLRGLKIGLILAGSIILISVGLNIINYAFFSSPCFYGPDVIIGQSAPTYNCYVFEKNSINQWYSLVFKFVLDNMVFVLIIVVILVLAFGIIFAILENIKTLNS